MNTTITTARLVLIPLDDDHVDRLLDHFRDPHVRRYLLDDMLVDRAWVANEVLTSRARFDAGGLGLYAAFPREAPDVLAGFAGFRPFYEPPILQLVYALGPAHVGRGLATEMGRAVIDAAFAGHGFSEVRASTDEPNQASVRVLERLGMTLVSREAGEIWTQLHFVLPRPGRPSTAREPDPQGLT
jgi:RimJ/RimL family protein N-acetyltransferase